MKKQRWVDVGKCIAILAVLTDHLRGSLYFSEKIMHCSFFSVSLFILLMGVTTYWSFDNAERELINKVKQKCIRILIPYTFAVFVYYVVAYKSFNWIEYYNYLIRFNISGPHYYVLLYLQLAIISPVIFYLLKKMSERFGKRAWIAELILGVAIVFVIRLSNQYTNIANIYAIRLFGGSYILVLYLGMLFGKYNYIVGKMNRRSKIVWLILSFAFISGFVYLFLHGGLVLENVKILGSIINPPGIFLMFYAISVMTFIFLIDNLAVENSLRGFEWIGSHMKYLGKNTLFVFLFHRLLLDYFLNRFFVETRLLIKFPLYYLTMILGSIAIGKMYNIIKKFVVSSYSYGRKLSDGQNNA